MAARDGGLSRYESLRRLQEVTDAALAHLSVDELLEELLTRIRTMLDADTSAVLLLDESGTELVARAAKGLEEEVERGVRIPVGRGFAGRIAAERRPVVLDDVHHADVLNPILREKGIKSLLGAPLLARDRVLGVVHVGTLTRRRFTAEEADLLQLAAERAALGLERAMIHDQLVALDSVRRDFVETAAHELRTPASVIYGVAKTLVERRGELDDGTARELIDTLLAASIRLAQLTADLLDFSRLEREPRPASLEPVRVYEAVAAVAAGLAPRGDEGIEIDIPDGLAVPAEREALERIVGNLIENSIVHGAPPVTVRATIHEDEARISVEDRGPGVPTALRARLFDAFARDPDATDRPGVGLGLAIARSYAHRLGGELVYEEAEPTGAIFTLVLPQRIGQAAER